MQLRNTKLRLGSTQVLVLVLDNQHAVYEYILFVQTYIQKYLTIHGNNPLITIVSSIRDALCGLELTSGQVCNKTPFFLISL